MYLWETSVGGIAEMAERVKIIVIFGGREILSNYHFTNVEKYDII